MPIDVAKLRSSVKRLSQNRRAEVGLTDTVRKLLPEIKRLRAEDRIPWSVIAAGLAEQGVVEGQDKRPLTEKRLTSIIAKLNAQSAKKAARDDGRRQRLDVLSMPKTSVGPPAQGRSSSLAPELTVVLPSTTDTPPLSEDEIRRFQRNKHSHLFRKD